MDTVNIHQAKTHLSQLLSRVKLGEEIVITNRGAILYFSNTLLGARFANEDYSKYPPISMLAYQRTC